MKNALFLGDKRMYYASLCFADKYNISTQLSDNKLYDLIALPVPVSRNDINITGTDLTFDDIKNHSDNNTIIAGAMADENVKKYFADNGLSYHDYYKEEFIIKNAAATAEGALKILIENTDTTIRGMKILLGGIGRISKILGSQLRSMGADVWYATSSREKAVWARIYGMNAISCEKLPEIINEFNAAVNTSPSELIGRKVIDNIKRNDIFILDLASGGRGADIEYAKKKNIPALCAPSLPPVCIV